MPLLTCILLGFVPMFLFAYILYWFDRYEKEPKILLGAVFFWGAVVAAGGAFILNTAFGIGIYLVTNSPQIADLATGSIVAPVIEESLKGLAVLLVFLIFYSEFDSVLDGIIYAGITALGFAAVENVYYIYQYGYLEDGWNGLWYLAFLRIVLVGWQHPFFTAFTGIGLATARLNKNWLIKFIAPILGWSAAVFTHSVHNALAFFTHGLSGMVVGRLVDWGGWFFMFGFTLWAIAREKKILKTYLAEEAETGILTEAQYRVATSSWAQTLARWTALFHKRYKPTARFYQACGELAMKKYQYDKFGNERKNAALIKNLREELADLSPRAQS